MSASAEYRRELEHAVTRAQTMPDPLGCWRFLAKRAAATLRAIHWTARQLEQGATITERWSSTGDTVTYTAANRYGNPLDNATHLVNRYRAGWTSAEVAR